MSRINYGENIWRLHDHVNNPDGSRWLFFRNAVKPYDYKVHSDIFAGKGTLACDRGWVVGE